MSEWLQARHAEAPAWVAAEMPPGYRTRLLEIERLTADLRGMDDIGRVLWMTGEPLRNAVASLFAGLECEVDAGDGSGPVTASLGDSRRLLLVVSEVSSAIQKTDDDLGRAFQAVQFAGPNDRVVLVANGDATAPPAERADSVTSEAAAILQRMGANTITGVTLFRLWRLSHEDRQKARKALDRLHSQDGGAYLLPAR